MRFILNEDKELVKEIITQLKDNDGYCPCAIEKTDTTKCMCKAFREEVAAGEYCHCGLYKKLEV